MPTLMLTARFVQSVKPTATRTEYFDEDVTGLALRVTPTGAKSWSVLYRHRGRLRRMTLGSERVITLASARERARDLLHDASKGSDPAAEKQAGRRAETIEDLATLYLEKWAKPRKRSWKADDNLLRRKILPRWRRRAIIDITRQDVRQLVEAVAEAGAPIVANRVAALLSKLFSFALDRDLVQFSPAVRIARPGVEKARDRVLTEEEIRAVWVTFEAMPAAMAAFYKLRLLTAQRGGEVASMCWRDVDLVHGWWTIPSSGTKNKLAHRVPLSGPAVSLLAAMLAEADAAETFVLAGARGKRQQAEACALFKVDDFRGHDLRRTAASYMASGGIPRLTIAKILNHVERSVTAVYDRHSYDPEKRSALEWWSVRLLATLSDDERGKVLPFVGAR
ncbi:MAG: tyrosine-type recombinase/integrase [Acidobacteriota bacterium]